MVRILTGVGKDGYDYNDQPTMLHEFRTVKEISLPNDNIQSEEDPTTLSYNLVLTLLLFSFDWLANGEFGPWAECVSARRPCGKCLWTSLCPCAYLSDSEASAVCHVPQCRRQADGSWTPRTHDGTMAEVRRLRAWTGTRASLETARTETGIMKNFFSSEGLLNDIVKDGALDTMHLHYCGMARCAANDCH